MPWEAPVTTARASGLGAGSVIRESYSSKHGWPGGHFLYTDFRRRRGLAEWEAALAGAPTRLVSRADIGAQVLRVNEKNLPRKQDMISHHGGLARCASEVTDWAFNGAVQSGEFCCRMYCFAKD
jgi:hypothetical protein